MFTGLITEIGEVAGYETRDGARRLRILAPKTSRALKIGDSVAVSGVCLTAVQVRRGGFFCADLAAETIAKTSLAQLRPGAKVNLELPLRAHAQLGGHIVQGHVDGVGKIISFAPARGEAAKLQRKKKNLSHNHRDAERPQKGDWWLRVKLPAGLARYVVKKGSITVEGISLTVALCERDEISIAIIPHTYSATNLHSLRAGDAANLEVDILAKYAEKLNSAPQLSRITIANLRAQGF